MVKNAFYIIILIVSFLFSACYFETEILAVRNEKILNFEMDEAVKDMVLKTPGRKFYLNPDPVLFFAGNAYRINIMSVRGQGSVKYRRKSFSVNLDKYISFDEAPDQEFERFKLIAMVYDYTYIENRLAHLMLNKIGLWPLVSFYTEVKLNDEHNGLYLFIEDPETWFFEQENADVMIRRDYDAQIWEIDINQNSATRGKLFYKSSFEKLYEIIVDYQGEKLYEELSKRMNLQMYFRKMAVDFILKNGDSTDEVFFIGTEKYGNVYFDIQPWDYDDLFVYQPHEIGNSMDIGTAFGNRLYATYDDLLKLLDGRLVFSVEDDLDYAITMDDFLYQLYLKELEYVVSQFSARDVQEIFESLKEQLDPFYAVSEVVAQSVYDQDATSVELYEKNLVDKEKFLIDRLNWIKKELQKQKNEM